MHVHMLLGYPQRIDSESIDYCLLEIPGYQRAPALMSKVVGGIYHLFSFFPFNDNNNNNNGIINN